jgi:hypothetical protein
MVRTLVLVPGTWYLVSSMMMMISSDDTYTYGTTCHDHVHGLLLVCFVVVVQRTTHTTVVYTTNK